MLWNCRALVLQSGRPVRAEGRAESLSSGRDCYFQRPWGVRRSRGLSQGKELGRGKLPKAHLAVGEAALSSISP